MIVVDTSIWVEVLRDGRERGQMEGALAGGDAYLARFTQMELLVGAGREDQWSRLERYLSVQKYAEPDSKAWRGAARTYFELRRMGKTVRSPIDCCIAEATIAHDASLLHRDRDFRAIASARPLRERWLNL